MRRLLQVTDVCRNRFCTKMICAIVGILFGFAAQQSFADTSLPREGQYNGTLELLSNGISPPFSFFLTPLKESLEPGAGTVKFAGAFTIFGEAGPYPWTSITFGLSTGQLKLSYQRPSNPIGEIALALTRSGSGNNWTGTLKKSGATKANVKVHWAGKYANVTQNTSFLVGTWRGACNDPDSGQRRIDLILQNGGPPQTSSVPANFDFENLPAKIGSLQFWSTTGSAPIGNIGFTRYIPHYFEDKYSFAFPAGKPGEHLQLALDLTLSAGKVFKGNFVDVRGKQEACTFIPSP